MHRQEIGDIHTGGGRGLLKNSERTTKQWRKIIILELSLSFGFYNFIYKTFSPLNFPQNIKISLNISRLIYKTSNISKMLFCCCLYTDLIMSYITECILNAFFGLRRNSLHVNAVIQLTRCPVKSSFEANR